MPRGVSSTRWAADWSQPPKFPARTATTTQPAARPAAIPAVESSITTHWWGARPSRASASW